MFSGFSINPDTRNQLQDTRNHDPLLIYASHAYLSRRSRKRFLSHQKDPEHVRV